MKSSTGKKVFLVSLFASKGKTDEGKEFDPIHDRQVNGKSLFATFQARKYVTDCIYLQVVVIWLDAFTGFNNEGS